MEPALSMVTGTAQSLSLTTVTDPKEPRQPVPASDRIDYLKTIPDFVVIRSGGSNGSSVLRGMFGSHLNIFTSDGMVLSACPNRTDALTSYISPETYDKLTVIKGPRTMLWGPGILAGTILLEREPERFGELGSWVNASLLVDSNGRFDKVLDAAADNRLGYLHFTGNYTQFDDYEGGTGNTALSCQEEWNGDVAVSRVPDEDTLIEFTTNEGGGEARYTGCGMDGSQFRREGLDLCFVKSNVSDVLERVETQIYYSYTDHIMDNFRLRTPDPSSMMPMSMVSQVDRRILDGRLAATWCWDGFRLVTGADAMRNKHRACDSKYDMMTDYHTDADQLSWDRDAASHNYGAFDELTWFAAERGRSIGGLHLDRTSIKDHRQAPKSGHAGHTVANPVANNTHVNTLPSDFVRYEHDLAGSPTTLYADLGHAECLPDYWKLFSSRRGPNGSANAFDKIKPEKATRLDFGLQYNGDKLQTWALSYIGMIRDFILSSYREGMMGSLTQATNADARIMGDELGASYRPTSNWKANASLAYVWGKNNSDDRALPQIPSLEARFDLIYEKGGWNVGSPWWAIVSQNRIARDQSNVVDEDFDKSAGFSVFSLNDACRVTRNVKLNAGVDSLFDKDYTKHLNKAGDAGFGFSANETVPKPGRTFWAKVDFSF